MIKTKLFRTFNIDDKGAIEIDEQINGFFEGKSNLKYIDVKVGTYVEDEKTHYYALLIYEEY
ncbi:hypothetical protein [Priestia megaterium]|uniref:hypothetical protein n=1 Tax=Priestia megaterium TaxID=1404 RepID=UPI003CC60BFE